MQVETLQSVPSPKQLSKPHENNSLTFSNSMNTTLEHLVVQSTKKQEFADTISASQNMLKQLTLTASANCSAEVCASNQRKSIHQPLSQNVAHDSKLDSFSPAMTKSRLSKSISCHVSADKEVSVYSSKARESLAKQHSIVDLVFHVSLATKYKQRNSSMNNSSIRQN